MMLQNRAAYYRIEGFTTDLSIQEGFWPDGFFWTNVKVLSTLSNR